MTPLVLLHGFTGSASSWAGLEQALEAAGHRVARVDLPGHGTRRGDRDPEAFTLDAVFALLEAVAGAHAAFDLLGYSMGARLALHYALSRPQRVRRLVLESGSPGLASSAERAERRLADEALAHRIVSHGVPAFVAYWEALPLFHSQRSLDPERAGRQRTIRLENDPDALAASLRGLGTGTLPSLWGRLVEVVPPTLLLTGSSDRKFTEIAERMESEIPLASRVEVGQCGHTVHLERPDAWLAAVTSFLSPAESDR